MHVEIPHKFSLVEAKKRVEQGIIQARPQVMEHAPDFVSSWEGDTMTFSATIQGKHITGTLAVEEQQFVLDVTLPLLWRIFEGKIERAIRDQVAAAS